MLVLGALGASLLGCDELRDIDSMGDQTRVPSGGSEKLRLFVPERALSLCELVPFRVERVAHEGDDLSFDPGRVRCATLNMVGRGVFVSGSDDAGNLIFSRQTQFDIDRGQLEEGLFTSQDSGTVVIQVSLLSAACAAGETPITTDAQRITTFAAVGDSGCLDPPIPDASPDADGGSM
ncbi:MAG: hypothetical protein AAGF12_34140 [Myxococcota bacterium]